MEMSRKTPDASPHPGNLPGGNGSLYSVQLLEKAHAGTDTALEELGSQLGGLSEAEADSRLKQVGMNEIAREKRQSALMLFLGNLKNPLVLLPKLPILSASPISLCVIKLLGPGEYVDQLPGDSAAGHFGLADKGYAHSTAPNRRYPDLITQRLLKTALAGHTRPYENDELAALAKHCTEEEDAAKKLNGRSQNPQQQYCWNQGSGSSSMP